MFNLAWRVWADILIASIIFVVMKAVHTLILFEHVSLELNTTTIPTLRFHPLRLASPRLFADSKVLA
jgi:hypothetical protein